MQKATLIHLKEPAWLHKSWWRSRGWRFWREPDLVVVEATQVRVFEDRNEVFPAVTAKVHIRVTNGKKTKLVHDAEMDWPAPCGEAMLLLQVYLLSKQPGYKDPKCQAIMEEFCFLHYGFKPPSKLYWSKGRPSMTF